MTTTLEKTDPGKESWARRGQAVAENCEAYRSSYEDELEARDRLIVEAVDLGWSRGQVARWFKVTPTRVTQIVARRCAEEL